MSYRNETPINEQKKLPEELPQRNPGKQEKLQNSTNEGRRQNVITVKNLKDLLKAWSLIQSYRVR